MKEEGSEMGPAKSTAGSSRRRRGRLNSGCNFKKLPPTLTASDFATYVAPMKKSRKSMTPTGPMQTTASSSRVSKRELPVKEG
jgi:hypothetical protein